MYLLASARFEKPGAKRTLMPKSVAAAFTSMKKSMKNQYLNYTLKRIADMNAL